MNKIKYVNEFQQITNDFINKHKVVSGITFIRGFNDGARAVLTTAPQYIEHSTVLSEPKKALVLPEAKAPEYCFFFDYYQLLEKSKSYQEVYAKEANMLNEKSVKQEFIYSIHTKSYSDQFSFYSTSSVLDANLFFLNNIDSLKQLSFEIYAEGNKLIKSVTKNPIVKAFQNVSKQDSNNKISVLDILTPKEFKVCYLLVKNKTAKEIASDMGVSYRTIEHHIERIKSKLNVQNRKELIHLLNQY